MSTFSILAQLHQIVYGVLAKLSFLLKMINNDKDGQEFPSKKSLHEFYERLGGGRWLIFKQNFHHYQNT